MVLLSFSFNFVKVVSAAPPEGYVEITDQHHQNYTSGNNANRKWRCDSDNNQVQSDKNKTYETIACPDGSVCGEHVNENIRTTTGGFLDYTSCYRPPTEAEKSKTDPDSLFEQCKKLSFDNNPKPYVSPSPKSSETAPDSTLDPETDLLFLTKPALEEINESYPCIEVIFNLPNLFPDLTRDYYLCTGDNSCITTGKVDTDNVKKKEPSKPKDDSHISFILCGNGPDELFVGEKCMVGDTFQPDQKKNNNDPRIEQNHYFWAGSFYPFSLTYKDESNVYHAMTSGGFYMSRVYPNVKVSPDKNLVAGPNSTIQVSILGGRRPPYQDSKVDKRNNYFISMKGGLGAYSKAQCTYTINGGYNGINFLDLKTPGTYTINVYDQTGEDNKSKSTITQTAADYSNSWGQTGHRDCSPGFLYTTITCILTDPKKDSNGGTCSTQINDPGGSEYRAFLEAMNIINKYSGSGYPCGGGKRVSRTSECKFIETAIGRISVESPEKFILSIFQFALVIAAFGGVILIMVSGYMMMISAGDKEKVQGARETITAAIVGLLFIVLSIVILEIIGVDILRLPGFTR